MTPRLVTPRLVLPPLEMADASAIQALFGRWEVVRYFARGVPWPYPPDGAATFLRDVAVPAMREGTEWHWSLRLASAPGTLIGVVSLMDREGDNRGGWLDGAHRGRGLMTEAVEAVTAFWFETLGREVLRVSKATANVASRRLSERTGMRLIGHAEREYVCGRLPAEIWEITRADRGQLAAAKASGAPRRAASMQSCTASCSDET